MAELKLTPTTSDCCPTEAQAACCEPGDKAACCGVSASGGRCGCSAGEAEPDIRESVRERYAAAAREIGARPVAAHP